MSIRPDTWIIKMAREKKMIEPFVEEQVRALDHELACSIHAAEHRPQVEASAEPARSPSEQHRACFALGPVERCTELVDHAVAECVGLAIVHPDNRYAIAELVVHHRLAHANLRFRHT